MAFDYYPIFRTVLLIVLASAKMVSEFHGLSLMVSSILKGGVYVTILLSWLYEV